MAPLGWAQPCQQILDQGGSDERTNNAAAAAAALIAAIRKVYCRDTDVIKRFIY